MSDPSSDPTDRNRCTAGFQTTDDALDAQPTTERPWTVRTTRPNHPDQATHCEPPTTAPDLSPAAAHALLKLLIAARHRSHTSNADQGVP
jgi:hypothetical protein